ncbi:hypothetical protein CVU82_03930 [Candidatus Falkowbacteria bacterium HGW-Falkowbacteria-1]|uniref:DUF4190 domain-containing protein n=1 Tax=Candidatus Falkowbacteria bacterium HGW-Falkowbacteria-1 TaxID=2013768 RepID=A0A2N2E8Y1_9BACT|nr:MAG: hypothetical protein CVU82_03930 [Candidatus Falkowbacteria bacterium HGW-Falkowbacteria-1]
MKKFKIFIFLVFLLFSSRTVSAAGSWGLDDVVNNKADLKGAFNTEEVNKYENNSSFYLSGRIGLIIGSILSFIGVLFMVLIIYGGLLWMTARGNEQQTEKAKSLIIQAIIGLVIVLSAYAITNLIGGVFFPSSSE